MRSLEEEPGGGVGAQQWGQRGEMREDKGWEDDEPEWGVEDE